MQDSGGILCQGTIASAVQGLHRYSQRINQKAFKIFLDVTAEVANFDADGKAFSLFLIQNPLGDLVILPAPYAS